MMNSLRRRVIRRSRSWRSVMKRRVRFKRWKCRVRSEVRESIGIEEKRDLMEMRMEEKKLMMSWLGRRSG